MTYVDWVGAMIVGIGAAFALLIIFGFALALYETLKDHK